MAEESIKKTLAQNLGEIGQTEVKRIFERNGWTVHGLDGSGDFGEDQLVRVFIGGTATELSFFVQVKATKRSRKSNKNIQVRIKTAHLDLWHGHTIPVFLVLWNEEEKNAYWSDIHAYVQKLDAKSKKWNEKVTHTLSQFQVLDSHGLETIKGIVKDWYVKFAFQIRGKDALTIQTRFAFPKTTEGGKAFKELENHFKTGSPIELSGEYILEFKFPSWYQRIEQIPPLTKSSVLYIGPKKGEKAFPVDFELSNSEDSLSIDDIELFVEQSGTEEVTVSNDSQNKPYKLKVKINKETKKTEVTIQTLPSAKVSEAHICVKMAKLLSQGCQLKVTYKNDGTVIANGDAHFNIQWSQEFYSLLTNLRHIEDYFNKQFELPEDGIDHQTYQAIEKLSQLVSYGKFESTVHGTLTFDFTISAIEKLIATHKDDRIGNIRLEIPDQKETILGETFDLGYLTYIYSNFAIKGGITSLERIKKLAQKTFTLELESTDSSMQQIIWPDWKPLNRKASS